MAISRILSGLISQTVMIIYLIVPCAARCPAAISRSVVRRYPEIGPILRWRTGCPPLFCLAPHGVFPASRLRGDAVSSYLAFSPLPALFSKNRRYVFCDTFRRLRSCGLQRPRILRGMLPYGVRTFLQ